MKVKKGQHPQTSAFNTWLAKGIAAQQGGDLPGAIASLSKAVLANPKHAVATHELGLAYALRGDMPLAESYYRLAIALDPLLASAHYNLGNLLIAQGQIIQALTCFQEAARLDPDDADALTNCGVAFYELGQVERAIPFFQKALAADPTSPDRHSTLASALHYLPTASGDDLLHAAQGWWQTHGRPLYRKILYPNPITPGRRLKVAYLSPDFREHSIYSFITPLLKAHDRSRFEILCLSDVLKPDWATEEIRDLSEGWRDIAHTTDEVVALIVEREGIDILVDLAGHMNGNRLRVFAKKPAPVQISWLGYPGTTGLPTIDYRLVDAITDPEGEADSWHSEQLVRLPGCFLCYQPPAEPITPGPPPCQRTGRFTFGSFNNPAKLNPPLLAIWATILKDVPGSRLLLKGKHLDNPKVQATLTRVFSDHGLDGTRLSFSPYLPSPGEHLALYNDIDLCLDPFPYNGTTTTLEALWMGVPVLTLLGPRHAGRVGASLLHSLGLPGLITDTPQAYIKTAIHLASDTSPLVPRGEALRRQLLKAEVCNPQLFAQRVEAIYDRAWQRAVPSLADRGTLANHATAFEKTRLVGELPPSASEPPFPPPPPPSANPLPDGVSIKK